MKKFRVGQLVKTNAIGIAVYGIDQGDPHDGAFAEYTIDEGMMGIVLAARESRIVLPREGDRHQEIKPDALVLLSDGIGWIYGGWLSLV